jgi:hypothetical protein
MKEKQNIFDSIARRPAKKINHMIVIGIQEMNFSMIGQV